MPSNRRRKSRSLITIGTKERLHLLRGGCSLGCTLCSGPRGLCPPGIEAYTLKSFAREVWRQNRTDLLSMWRSERTTEPQAGFAAAASRGYGDLYPAFGEVVFDGVPWPPCDPSWSEDAREVWEEISDHLEDCHAKIA